MKLLTVPSRPGGMPGIAGAMPMTSGGIGVNVTWVLLVPSTLRTTPEGSADVVVTRSGRWDTAGFFGVVSAVVTVVCVTVVCVITRGLAERESKPNYCIFKHTKSCLREHIQFVFQLRIFNLN